MTYRVGTHAEAVNICHLFPDCVQKEILRCTAILDTEYGVDRDYLDVGGYVLIAETAEDIQSIKTVVDYDNHPCEWAERFGEYLGSLYLMNNEFSIVLLMPEAIAPDAIVKELED